MDQEIVEDESTLKTAQGALFLRRVAPPRPRLSLVIAHGAAEHSVYWRAVASTLASTAGAAVLIPDLPGHGKSEGARLSVDEGLLVAAIDVVVERHAFERPGLPVVLLGHSMGGLAAARYAQLYGEKLALLILHAAGLAPAAGWGGEPKVMALEEMTPDPDLQRIILTDELRSSDAMPGSSRAALGAAAERAMAAPPLGPLPVIWLQGQDDALIPEAAARVAFARLGPDRGLYLSYPGVGHGGILERAGAQMLLDLQNGLRLMLRQADDNEENAR